MELFDPNLLKRVLEFSLNQNYNNFRCLLRVSKLFSEISKAWLTCNLKCGGWYNCPPAIYLHLPLVLDFQADRLVRIEFEPPWYPISQEELLADDSVFYATIEPNTTGKKGKVGYLGLDSLCRAALRIRELDRYFSELKTQILTLTLAFYYDAEIWTINQKQKEFFSAAEKDVEQTKARRIRNLNWEFMQWCIWRKASREQHRKNRTTLIDLEIGDCLFLQE